jgi:hypothetical protein
MLRKRTNGGASWKQASKPLMQAWNGGEGRMPSNGGECPHKRSAAETRMHTTLEARTS